MSHAWKMLIGCLLAFVVLFLLPVFGVGEGTALFVFVAAMFLCHAMMMFGHKHGDDDSPNNHKEHHA